MSIRVYTRSLIACPFKSAMRMLIPLVLAIIATVCMGQYPDESDDLQDIIQRALQKGNSGDDRGALKLFRQALELSPNDSGLLNNVAVGEMRLGQTDSAIEHLERAVELNPFDDNPMHNIWEAIKMAEQGRIDPE